MKIKELVNKLQEFPDDFEVLIWDMGQGGTVPVKSIDFSMESSCIILE